MIFKAGLPASGLSYRLRLPILADSGMLQLSSPVTAAGPRRILTVFPFKAKGRFDVRFATISIAGKSSALLDVQRIVPHARRPHKMAFS